MEYFVGEGGLPGTDSDDRNVIESAGVGDGGWRQVALGRMGNDDRVHLLGDQVVAPVDEYDTYRNKVNQRK